MELDTEIIDDFKSEAKAILEEVKTSIETLEEGSSVFPKEALEDFANKLDRLMGTAETISQMYEGYQPFQQIGKFSALCKATGYKAATLNNVKLIPIFAAFWADTLDIVEELVDNIEDEGKLKEVTKNYIPVLQKRLIWLAQQIINQTKGTEAGESKINVDGLLKKLGLDV